MAKVRLNPCYGISGAGLNSVPISGGDSKQKPNFAVNPSAVTLQAFDSAIVTVVSSSSPAPWQCYSSDGSDLFVSAEGDKVTLKSGATGVNKNVFCNFYQSAAGFYFAILDE